MSRENDEAKLNNYGREFNSQRRGGNSRFSVVIKKKNDRAAEEKGHEDRSRDISFSEGNSEDNTSKDNDTSERKRIYPFEKRRGSSYGRVGEDSERPERGAWRSDRDSKRRGGFGGKRGREGFSDRYQKRGTGDSSFSGGRGIRKGSFRDTARREPQREYVFDEENALLKVGEVGLLKVKEMTKIGAFLDIGLPKDVLLPFREQTYGPKPGEDVLVYIYRDKSDRVAATMRVYSHLSAQSPYNEDDTVEGIIYEISDKLGAFVAVDNKYFGLIPPSELYRDYKEGERVECRVLKKREDGKLDLSPRKKAYQQMDEDTEIIISELDKNNGILGYDDKSISAEEVSDIYHMSKAQFKRALGRLLKEGRVEIGDGCIKKLK